jgi:hypothetical protein
MAWTGTHAHKYVVETSANLHIFIEISADIAQ